MPRLKQLSCTVKLPDSEEALKEHGTSYEDGRVQCYITVPERPSAFLIHLTSKGYIAPGLSMWVYIDGEYQCNRNKVNLEYVEPNSPRKPTEVDFKVRQKETVLQTGLIQGRPWQFHKLGGTTRDDSRLHDLSRNGGPVGTIEVVVLRCALDAQASKHASVFGPPPDTQALGLKPRRWSWNPGYYYEFSQANSETPANDEVKEPSARRAEEYRASFGLDGIWDGEEKEPPVEPDVRKSWGWKYVGAQKGVYGGASALAQDQQTSYDPTQDPMAENSQHTSTGEKEPTIHESQENPFLQQNNPFSQRERRDSWDSRISDIGQRRWQSASVVGAEPTALPNSEDRNSSVPVANVNTEFPLRDAYSPAGQNAPVSGPEWTKSFGDQKQDQTVKSHKDTSPQQDPTSKDRGSSSTSTAIPPKPTSTPEVRPDATQYHEPRFKDESSTGIENEALAGSTESPGFKDQSVHNPIDVTNKSTISHQVKAGDSIPYLHKFSTPMYVDGLDEPYASFVFRYGGKATVEKALNPDIKESGKKERQQHRVEPVNVASHEATEKKQVDRFPQSSVPPNETGQSGFEVPGPVENGHSEAIPRHHPELGKKSESRVDSQSSPDLPANKVATSTSSAQKAFDSAPNTNVEAEHGVSDKGNRDEINNQGNDNWLQNANDPSQATQPKLDKTDEVNSHDKSHGAWSGSKRDETSGWDKTDNIDVKLGGELWENTNANDLDGSRTARDADGDYWGRGNGEISGTKDESTTNWQYNKHSESNTGGTDKGKHTSYDVQASDDTRANENDAKDYGHTSYHGQRDDTIGASENHSRSHSQSRSTLPKDQPEDKDRIDSFGKNDSPCHENTSQKSAWKDHDHQDRTPDPQPDEGKQKQDSNAASSWDSNGANSWNNSAADSWDKDGQSGWGDEQCSRQHDSNLTAWKDEGLNLEEAGKENSTNTEQPRDWEADGPVAVGSSLSQERSEMEDNASATGNATGLGRKQSQDSWASASGPVWQSPEGQPGNDESW